MFSRKFVDIIFLVWCCMCSIDSALRRKVQAALPSSWLT